MNKYKQLGVLGAVVALVSACGNTPYELPFKIITPVGAPAVAFYPFANNARLETNSIPANVSAALASAEGSYDIVVFDAINGLKMIQNNQLPFRLATILTSGNFYLVSLNNQEDAPTSDDYIVSFGENLVPDLVYRNLYPSLTGSTHYVAGAQQAAATVCTGMHDSHDVDYVIAAQPALYTMMNNASCATYGRVKIVANIREAWQSKTGQSGIPQAGLFVRESTYTAHRDEFIDFTKQLQSAIQTLLQSPEKALEAIESVGDVAAQRSFFGVSGADLVTLMNDGNALGLTNGGVDLEAFLTSLGLDSYPSTLYTDTYY